MTERIEQMYMMMERGLVISLPPESTKKIADAVVNGEVLPWDEGQRLSLIEEDSIMKRRHPTAQDGQKYMERVDIDWREALYKDAEQLATKVGLEMERKGKERVAVLLFGSVAKSLVRKRTDEDPSNIDMAIIGDFTEQDRIDLYDCIRPDREDFQKRVGSNLGVHIQNWDKIRNGDYNAALNYIASSGRVLYDPSGLWKEVEQDALNYVHEQRMKKKVTNEIRGTKRFMGIQQSRSSVSPFFTKYLSTLTAPVPAFVH